LKRVFEGEHPHKDPGRVFFCARKDDMPYTNVSQNTGDGILMWDGNKEVHISQNKLEALRSAVVTHEGENLTGEKARKYMDRYSKECLGRDLSGSYKNTEVQGYVK
jgi:hypothetical protein